MTAIIIDSRKYGRIETLIDTEDLEKVKQANSWYANYNDDTRSFYVESKDDKGKYLRLHRLIMDVEGFHNYVDHVNHNTLDNRKSNLNIVSNAENQQNRRLSRNNSSGHHGVTFRKDKNKWQARISIDGKETHLGYFTDKSQAITARKAAEDEHYLYKKRIS